MMRRSSVPIHYVTVKATGLYKEWCYMNLVQSWSLHGHSTSQGKGNNQSDAGSVQCDTKKNILECLQEPSEFLATVIIVDLGALFKY